MKKPHAKEKVEAAIRMLKTQGHTVEISRGEKGTWYTVDERMRLSFEEMQHLADGVYSLNELEDLFRRRQAGESNSEQ
jgi:hypothetical protein